MQQCGFCSMLSGMVRRAMCLGSRRDSNESYYRELGDQETLKIEDKSSDLSEYFEDTKRFSHLDEAALDGVVNERPACHSRFLTMQGRRKKRLVTRTLRLDQALLDDLQPAQVQCTLNQSVQWRFNAFVLENVSGGRCLPVLCLHLFHVHGLLTHFRLDVAKVWKLCSLIEEGYHSTNPYHNSVHAADVTQAMHCFLRQEQIRAHLEPLEVLASLIAAIAHDVDHPGVNQPFLIATSNHLAALYKNTSVLENHHWRSAISCLIESGLLDQLEGLQKPLERLISSLILATDITRQQEYLSQFKGHLDAGTLDLSAPEHRHLVLQIALKCADISNPCRPWGISHKWSMKVCEEFFLQGDCERKLKLPLTALCDRHSISIPKIQTGFFKFVVTPLISEWHRFLHNELSSQMLGNLRFNQAQWERLVRLELGEGESWEADDAEAEAEAEAEEEADNVSNSSELLLPRRASMAPTRSRALRDQLRRFSVPLGVFQDGRLKLRERSGASTRSSDRALQAPAPSPAPRSTVASLTAPQQARLLRQQTFPPPAPPRPPFLHASTPRIPFEPSLFGPGAWLGGGASGEGSPWAEARAPRRESAPTGSQLRDNVAAALPLQPGLLRRQSMPADIPFAAPKEIKKREILMTLPALLRRTLAGAGGERWQRRRDSAPAAGTARRKPGAVHLHLGLGKGCTVYEHASPRRSSLPVEVLTGTPNY